MFCLADPKLLLYPFLVEPDDPAVADLITGTPSARSCGRCPAQPPGSLQVYLLKRDLAFSKISLRLGHPEHMYVLNNTTFEINSLLHDIHHHNFLRTFYLVAHSGALIDAQLST